MLTATHVEAFQATLASGELPTGSSPEADAARVDLLRSLEQLKNAAAAAQADLAVALDASQRSQQAAAGEPARHQGRGVAAQVALARQESPHRGGVLLGLAKALVELPHTREAMRTGILSEYAAILVARETAILEPADRLAVDEQVCGDHETVVGRGTRRLVAEVRRRALAIDPAAAVRRARRAESERCVSLRPAPDTMTYLTALLPVAQGVAVLAALRRTAERARADGDERGRGQVMADTLVELTTGQASADAVGVQVGLVMSDATLLGAGHEPALLDGHVVPAQVARELVARASEADAASVRRLYATPDGELVAMTSLQRLVRGALADFLRARDQGLCRTPWCDAPVRHSDHVTGRHPGNSDDATTAHGTQGLCEACNYAKQAPLWRARACAGLGRHRVETTTPTGHRYSSTAPRPPRPARPVRTSLDRELDRIAREAGLEIGWRQARLRWLHPATN